MRNSNNIVVDIPRIKFKYLNALESEYLYNYCKLCLYYSARLNNFNECAVVIDSFDYNRYELFKGNKSSVSIEKSKLALENKNGGKYLSRFIVIHNHTSNGGFSNRDIESFLSRHDIFCLLAIQPNYRVHFLLKESSNLPVSYNWFLKSGMTVNEFCKNSSNFCIEYINKGAIKCTNII